VFVGVFRAGAPGRIITAMTRTPTVLAAELLLMLLPIGHLVVLPVAGAAATGADLALLLLLVVWGAERVARPARAAGLARVLAGERVDGLPPRRYLTGLAVLVGFGLWVGLSGSWGFHAPYAVAKGAATVALVLGAGALATSGIEWRRAVDAWLGGAALALGATAILGLTGTGAVGEVAAPGGWGVAGLSFPRLAGPFLHPEMFGDYLVVTAILLWALWPTLEGRAHAAGLALAGAVTAGLLLTASAAWVGGGLAVAVLGARAGRRGSPVRGVVIATGGVLVSAAVAVALVVPLDLHLGPVHVATTALRPSIWRESLLAVTAGPILGVGAAPFLASVPDPLAGMAPALWDAHNAYLSVLGQFGAAGFLLAGAGLWLAVSGVRRAVPPSRERTAILLALLAVAVHAVFMASEDLRHAWMLVGLAGVLAAGGSARAQAEPAKAPRP
jgi:O-antigen ligase